MPELGEKRPRMMGTPAYMPLELVVQEDVITHESQDAYAMGVMAFLVCMAPDKPYLVNMLASPVRERETGRERGREQR